MYIQIGAITEQIENEHRSDKQAKYLANASDYDKQ